MPTSLRASPAVSPLRVGAGDVDRAALAWAGALQRPAAMDLPLSRGRSSRRDLADVQGPGRPRGRRLSGRSGPRVRCGQQPAPPSVVTPWTAGAPSSMGRGGGRRAPNSGNGSQPANRPSWTDRGCDRHVPQHLGGLAVDHTAVAGHVDPCGRRTGRRVPSDARPSARWCRGPARAGPGSRACSSAAVGSRAEVGSSSTRTLGWVVRTAPIADPLPAGRPTTCAGARRRSSAIPSRSRVSSTRRRITWVRGRAVPCRRPARPRRCR